MLSGDWRLIDAVSLGALYPELCQPPLDADLLLPGDTVRIGLRVPVDDVVRAPMSGERFWVRVTDRVPGGTYTGQLGHDLRVFNLQRGDTIAFGPQHVMDMDA